MSMHDSANITGKQDGGKGWFPLSRKFYVRTGVNLTGFTCVNKIRDDVWTDYVNVKSWKRSTF